MRLSLLSTTAVALLCLAPLTTVSFAAEKTTAQKSGDAVSDAWVSFKAGAKEAWDATAQAFDDMTRKTQQDIILPKALPGALSAKALIGTPIENAKEGRVGSISDFVLDKNQRVEAIVVSDGGFLGLNNGQIPVKPGLISIQRDPKGALKARTNVTEGQLDSAFNASFTTRIEAMKDDFKKPDVKTASKLIGAPVVGADGKPLAVVTDILMSPIGEARYALLTTGGMAGVGSKIVAVPVTSLTFTSTDKPLQTAMTAEQLGKLAAVRMEASSS